jgi:hypothetical protein
VRERQRETEKMRDEKEMRLSPKLEEEVSELERSG